ncbi:MAG: SpoIID/LytB domain-containing protein [Candidatus Omnitrophica bacterium]|nr:SpoIID/LytB domain-containing protein [Candidatus Omnitrophota bacterium]
MKNFFLFLLLIIKSDLTFAQEEASPIILRVAVFNNVPTVEISFHESCSIEQLNNSGLIEVVSYLKKAKVFPSVEGLKIGERYYKVSGIKIKPLRKKGEVVINGRKYRGEIDILKTEGLKLLVINHVELEEYLYGVLCHEVSLYWPMEALKAHAIASRTYALYQQRINKNKDYDLTSDFYSQVYGGRNAERYRTTRAVNLTKGKVLIYKGELFPAYFHATCGGATEDASELWNIDIPPLKGVKCDFCYQSPHYLWERFISMKELKEKLSANGYYISGKILGIVPKEKNASGRIRKLNVIAENGKFEIAAKEFRQIFDPQVIRSTNFEVELESDGAVFRGYGWGHGVGLCQWGAYFMAIKGYKSEEILRFYYPGTEIKSVIGNR